MKPKIAVHKFASCDGCQLAFLNAGEQLITLARLVDIVHFPEAGPLAPDAEVDIAFVEGSITTPHDRDRIQRIRDNSRYLITLGACATAGGLQALRNYANAEQWTPDIYAKPEYVQTLATSTAISEHVKVDLELWGCPVNAQQVLLVIRDIISSVTPRLRQETLCIECKRQQNICHMVTRGLPCMGPVTRAGCGAICPKMGRDCYACFGPAENSNSHALGQRLQGLGLLPADVARRFLFVNNSAPEYRAAGKAWLNSND